MSNEKDPFEGCLFRKVQFVLYAPEKKRRRRPLYVLDEVPLWVVRYLYKSASSALPERGHTVLRAPNKEQVRQKFTAWLDLVLHEEATIESVELLAPDTLKRLTPQ
jgi:hypothetical protein